MNLRGLGSFRDFPGGSPEVKESTCNAGETEFVLEWECFLEEGMATTQHSLTGESMDRGAR